MASFQSRVTKVDYIILRVLLVHEISYDRTATFSIQSFFDCLVDFQVDFQFCAVSKAKTDIQQ